jgi:hypothetical protein
VRRPNIGLSNRRERIIRICRESIGAEVGTTHAAEFEGHVSDAANFELCFTAVLETLKEQPISKLQPAAQIWAAIEFARIQVREIQRAIGRAIEDHDDSGVEPFNPKAPLTLDSFGRPTDVEDAHHTVVAMLGATIGMLGHQNSWYEPSTGRLVLPVEVPVSQADAEAARMHMAGASRWSRIEDAWDFSRLFSRGTKCITRERESGSVSEQARTVIAESDFVGQLLDRISLDRLMMLTYGDLTSRIAADPKLHIRHARMPRRLPPQEFFCEEERTVFTILLGVYGAPMDDPSHLMAGLPMAAWLRGYILLSFLASTRASDAKDVGIIDVSSGFLEEQLALVGLSANQASRFIDLVTFSRDSVDLSDSPILQIADGSRRFCSLAYLAPSVGVILLSRLHSLNRASESRSDPSLQCDFSKKGKNFELAALFEFRDAGILADSISYNLDGVQYDCDVVAVHEDALIVIECKNRSLPLGHVPGIYYFIQQLRDAAKQVVRIAEQLNANPSIVRDRLGPNVRWNRTVPIVLNAMPWSMGRLDGAFVYDYSALGNLFGRGYVEVGMMSIRDGSRTRRFALRKGPVPTVGELLAELSNPIQNKIVFGEWRWTRSQQDLSGSVSFACAEWLRVAEPLEAKLVRLGESKEVARRIVGAMATNSTSKAEMVIGPARKRVATSGRLRNQPCPCGSGKKSKRCCM